MGVFNKLKKIRLSWTHIIIIFLILIIFQIFVSRLQQETLSDSISQTMEWSKQNSAEQIGNLTAATLEILVEQIQIETWDENKEKKANIINALNSTLKQPLMNRNVETVCLLVTEANEIIALDVGTSIFNHFSGSKQSIIREPEYNFVVNEYKKIHRELFDNELTTTVKKNDGFFYVFVPLVPRGEYSGAVFLKIKPDVSAISKQVLAGFNKTVLIFSTLILVGLVAMLLLSTFITLERDEARELLYKEREQHLTEHIAQKKEHLFTKRIYHTHHKAEKVMGFINEDLEVMTKSNLEEIKYRVSKYANFIARVIYDMKWFNPPINTMRGPIFSTDLNELLKFIVKNIFLRVSHPVSTINFNFNLDNNVPKIKVNEFVMWEIIEPIIQNSIDHTDKKIIIINIITEFDEINNQTKLIISDNGPGIDSELIQTDKNGIKKIFIENITTKEKGENHGYGCYISYEIASRCGWSIDAINNNDEGCSIILTIKHI